MGGEACSSYSPSQRARHCVDDLTGCVRKVVVFFYSKILHHISASRYHHRPNSSICGSCANVQEGPRRSKPQKHSSAMNALSPENTRSSSLQRSPGQRSTICMERICLCICVNEPTQFRLWLSWIFHIFLISMGLTDGIIPMHTT